MALQFEILPVTPFLQNCALLWDDETREAVFTDVGGETERLLAEAARRDLLLKGIWLTHGHVDHAGGVAEMRRQTGLPVSGPHPDEAFWLDALPDAAAAYRFPATPAIRPDTWLNEGNTLQLGRHRFEVLHIPGHTPGHVVFYCREEKLLIAGDVLFYESIGRTDFPRGNHADLIRNIRSKLLVLPEDTRVLPGHGAMTTIGHEKRHNPFL